MVHTEKVEEKLSLALARLDEATADREAAQERVSAAARDVAEAITRRSAEGAGDQDLARALYWDYPDVPVPVIGALLGVATNRVAGAVGGRVVEHACSNACGRMVTWVMRSRNESRPTTKACSTCVASERERGLPSGWMTRPIGS